MKIGRNPSTGTHLRQLTGMAEFCEVDPSEDLARIAAVRKALGPQAKLMVDVNCAWSPAFAIEMGREMAPYKLYWIEEPVHTDDIDGSARVADALDAAIAGYETETEPLRLPRADHPRRGRYRPARHRLDRRVLRGQAHRRLRPGASPHGRAARLWQRRAADGVAALRRVDSRTGWCSNGTRTPTGCATDLLKHGWRLESDGTVRLPERPGLGDRARPRRTRPIPGRLNLHVIPGRLAEPNPEPMNTGQDEED